MPNAKRTVFVEGSLVAWHVDDEDVEIAISEALALMPNKTPMEEKGRFVRERLYAWGFRIMREE